MHWTDRLSEYLDGELSPGEDAACAAHLEACEGCREVLRDLQLVVLTARADRDREPRDGWAGVRAQLAGARTGHAPPRREIAFSLPQLALAASLLIAVTAAVSHLATGRVAEPAPAAEPAIQAMAEPLMPPSPDVTPANFADAQFDQAVDDLERILREQRQTLDPRTVIVIERNLTIIDEAIRQARAALDADPANTYLNSHLAEARRRKLDLLRRATSLTSGAGD